MSTNMARLDEVGPWTQEKLDLLEAYLKTYTSIMNTDRVRAWCSGRHYIDAFAGSVTPFSKEEMRYIDGSPLIALKTTPGFHSFLFIDKDGARINNCVEPLKSKFPESNITTEIGDCNDILLKKIIPKFPQNHRAFIFLDPYGLELNWSTVEAIGKKQQFDVFINFSVMGIYRNLGDQPPTGKNRDHINRVMGNGDWFGDAYQKPQQMCLFPEMQKPYERKNHLLAERLAKRYAEQLKLCFGYSSRPIIMRGPTDAPMYAMILASHQELAVDKMHYIFDRHKK